MRVTLPYPPSANNYWRAVKGRVIKSEEARHYQQGVRLRWLTQRTPGDTAVPTGPLSVIIAVYRPRRIGDLDNTLKVLLDSLRGIAFVDDSQVVELHAIRFDDKANPRAEVRVEPIIGDGRLTRSTGASTGLRGRRGLAEGAKP